MAKRKYAVVSWQPEDVIENAREIGAEITDAEAARLLAAEETRIADAMVAAGWKAIEGVLARTAS